MDISAYFNDQLAQKLPVVYYAMPGSGEIIGLLDNEVYRDRSVFNFVASPFDKNETAIGIRGDFSFENAVSCACPLDSNDPSYRSPDTDYVQMLTEAKARLESGRLEKIVLSRTLRFPLDPTLNIVNALRQYILLNPNAFCYLLYHPDCGIWMGATPETLVRKSNSRYSTIALAGSKPANSEAVWGKKEIEEHEFVSDFIKQQLDSIQARHIRIGEPKTINAGAVDHLQTDFSFECDEDILTIANALHPTPAVCGTPFKLAYQLIPQLEKQERKLYTGFIGPIQSNEEALFVNLRSMQIVGREAILYVGGGITKSSDINKEWKETELKSETMLKVLRNL